MIQSIGSQFEWVEFLVSFVFYKPGGQQIKNITPMEDLSEMVQYLELTGTRTSKNIFRFPKQEPDRVWENMVSGSKNPRSGRTLDVQPHIWDVQPYIWDV
jgi:hypothetical protein